MTVASNTSVRNKVDVRDVIYIRGMVFTLRFCFPMSDWNMGSNMLVSKN